MNIKSLLITIVVSFIAIFVTDGLIHGLWLTPVYEATASLWRSKADRMALMPCLMAGQFLAAATFSLLWAVGFADKAKVTCAMKYGVTMGLFSQANTLMTYAVTPITGEIAVKWFFAGLVQAVLVALVVFFVYKPKPVA